MSIFETPSTALRPVLDEVGPHKLDHARVVVAIGEIVVKRGEAVLLARLLHAGQLCGIKLMLVDISPIVPRGVRRETRGHGTVSAHDYIVLASAAIPPGKVQLAAGILNDSRCAGQLLGNIDIRAGAITVPSNQSSEKLHRSLSSRRLGGS